MRKLWFWAIVLFTTIKFTSTQNNDAETVVINAAFEAVAPCPCDLTRGSCDIGCCCDSTCNDDQRRTFSGCIPYLAGGQPAKTQQYRCSSDHFNKADWFPFLCVIFEYNAFLGYFFDWQYKLANNNTQTFLSRLYTAARFYWYREEEDRVLTDPQQGVYRYGISVKTSNASGTPRRGQLTIPQPVLNGQCLYTAPVRFLKNLEHSCTYSMSNNLCSASSVLSSLYYIQSSNLQLTTFFSVLEEESSLAIAETNVVYKCATVAYLQNYLRSTQTYSNLVNRTQVYKFNYNLPTNPNCVDSCGNDICIDLNNLTNPDSATPVVNIPDCVPQLPSQPTLTGQTCTNAVIDVSYTIRWNASKIARLDAVIVLADIPIQNSLGTGVNVLSQKYRVTFRHIVNEVGTGSSDNFYNITTTAYSRSGRVGYDTGKPIFTGSEVNNMTVSPPTFMYVNTNSTRQMAVFNTGADGLCMNAGRRTINFREDITTRCSVRLDINEFSDCSGLRKLIINRLNSLMPSDLIGRRGYNDPNNRGYWLRVLRENLAETCQLAEYFPLGLSPVDGRTGVCFNMTDGIHLEVFYGVTGNSNNYPIYEILGSKVSYSNSTWSLTCSGPAGRACTRSSTQPFYLTSSVRFTQIPPQTPVPVSKYYATPREDDKELCPGDRCWDNLFYPFTGRYMSDSREYVFGTVSLAIIFFVGYLLVTRPFY